ncbi:MAG TPA: GtrA family protein [Verrucomicrobiales bacterium]|nr:GtrA family protein [Verrucomicrobiales bacterium]
MKSSFQSRLRHLAARFSLDHRGGLMDLLIRPDTHPGIQFIKYSMAGAGATVIHLSVFYLLSTLVLPAIDPALGDTLRARRATINITAGFLVANSFAYLVNARWIFIPGRHPRWREVSLFFAVSGFSYVLGTLAMRYAIVQLGLNSHIAVFSYVVCSVFVNFVCRKFVVFRG